MFFYADLCYNGFMVGLDTAFLSVDGSARQCVFSPLLRLGKRNVRMCMNTQKFLRMCNVFSGKDQSVLVTFVHSVYDPHVDGNL